VASLREPRRTGLRHLPTTALLSSRPSSLSGMAWATPLVLILALVLATGCAQDRDRPSSPQPDLTVRAVVFAPHPDDETIAFGGLIYQMVHSGHGVRVVVATDGDAYVDACAFWKNGCLPGLEGCPADSVPTCSPAEMAAFGLVRRSESRRATALLGLPPEDISFLGYPDGVLDVMYNHPDSLVQSNSSRTLSETGRSFLGSNFAADVEEILRRYPAASVYTTHPTDHHRDHRGLAWFVQAACTRLSQESGGYPLYWSVVHDPGAGRDLAWPLPVCTWEPDWSRREERYEPTSYLTTPSSMAEQGLSVAQDSILWNPAVRTPPLLREALDCYQSQAGFILRDGSQPAEHLRGCLDDAGFLLAFVRRNYLLWPAAK
jgi:LmbE family N-acetylglucosaminyl deacetylase